VREILGPVSALLVAGKPVALARVVEVVGSGVHPAGAAIAVSEDGEVFGSASGGCVESALVDEARAMLASGGPPRLRTFGCSDDEAFDIGLTCGGLVRVLIERIGPATQDGAAPSWARELAEIGRSGKGAALVEVIDGPEDLLGSKTVVCEAAPAETGPVFGPAVLADALADLAEERSASHTYPVVRGDLQVDVTMFVDAFPAPPLMLVAGAASFACALTAQAKLLGYKVVVCDARAVFASPRRFPLADEVVVEWPNRYLERTREAYQERDAICVLTHDPKFDVPTIVAALATAAGYIGVMGSRRTQADRRRRLREAGVDEAQLGRLRGPLGLDLGARSPEETAVSICAEIIAARRGGAGGPLATSAGPIHPGRPTNPTAPGLLGPGATPDPPDGQR
jgi:xanthine dehydrogenase accessory factor